MGHGLLYNIVAVYFGATQLSRYCLNNKAIAREGPASFQAVGLWSPFGGSRNVGRLVSA